MCSLLTYNMTVVVVMNESGRVRERRAMMDLMHEPSLIMYYCYCYCYYYTHLMASFPRQPG